MEGDHRTPLALSQRNVAAPLADDLETGLLKQPYERPAR